MNEQLKIIISAQIDKLKQNVDKAKQEIKSFKEQVKEASANVDENLSKMGSGISTGLKTAAGATAAVSASLLALAGSTAEYRNEQAKLLTAFETSGKGAETAKNTYNDLYRVLGDSGTAVEAANHLAKLSVGQKELAEYTDICQGVYATFGNSLPIEGLTEAVNHTVNLGEVQGTLADALEWSGISTDSFNEKLAACNTEAEREKLIRETLNGLYSDAAAKYETNNAQILAQNEAQAKLQESTAKVGESLAPVLTALTTLGADVLTAISPYLQSFAENYLPVIQEILGGIAPLLESTLGFISEHKVILAVMAGIIAGIAAAIGLYNAVAAVKAAMDAAQVATLGALIKVQAAQAVATITAIAPYLAIVAAIAAVIAIIVLCVKHWDKISAVITAVAKWVANQVVEMVNVAVSRFKKMISAIGQIFSGLFGIVKNIFDAIVIRIETAFKVIGGIVSAIGALFTGNFSKAKSSVLGIFDDIRDGIKKRITNAKEIVGSVIQTIKGLFNFTFNLPRLPIPRFSIKPAGWKVGDLLKGSIPKLDISWNALGGVFDKPTILPYGGSLQGLGEDGAEAIVPLERNTQWLDRLATMLNEKQGGSKQIVLEVDGKVFAQTSINSINQLTRQTGHLALEIV